MKLYLIIGFIILGLLGAIELQRRANNTLAAVLQTEQENYRNLDEKYNQEQATVKQLKQQDQEKAEQQVVLAHQHKQLEETNNLRLKKILELQNDIEELRQWATQPLPDFIIRLRERPAITGSNSYCKYLQHTGGLSLDASQCAN